MVACVHLGSVWGDMLKLKGSREITFEVWGIWELKGSIANSFQALNMKELKKGQEENRRLEGKKKKKASCKKDKKWLGPNKCGCEDEEEGRVLGMEKKAGIWGESGYAEEMDVKN